MPTPTLCTTFGWMYSTHIEWLLIHIAPGEIMSIHCHHALTSLTGSVTLKNSCTWIPAKSISCPRFHHPPTLPKKKKKKQFIIIWLQLAVCSLRASLSSRWKLSIITSVGVPYAALSFRTKFWSWLISCRLAASCWLLGDRFELANRTLLSCLMTNQCTDKTPEHLRKSI